MGLHLNDGKGLPQDVFVPAHDVPHSGDVLVYFKAGVRGCDRLRECSSLVYSRKDRIGLIL